MQRTLMDEIFLEYDMENAEAARLTNELGIHLNEAEAHEFGTLFSKLKSLAQKGYRKVRPVVAAAKIAAALLPGATANNVATYIENQRNRYRDQAAIVERDSHRNYPR
ncbi:MAG: hypothetical protein JO072_13175 [Parafilimonas sp.]|nr:hypothetical protein [Parafilimonas sp.]